ncbi:MAG: PorP/SprF family type IX secretion system membrane protein [Bacteroidales bacterium]|jgi:type IX secretion system PorP/SprF family membrane protein|nr:PorP/SprF family type IX secretion system membrane protein [Bacteroidales bacterium]
MQNFVKLFFAYIITSCSIVCIGQDVHFSTFDANYQFLNPALTAFGSNTFRIGTIFRNQWATVSNGYNTYMLSLEAMPYNSRIRQQAIGLGINLLSDEAGTLAYGQKNIMISISYFKAIDKNKNHYISFGLEGETSSLNYDETKANFSPFPEDNEGILLNRVRTFSWGVGLHWQIQANSTHNFQAGASLHHINRPSLSYFEDKTSFLPMKFSIYFSDAIAQKYDNAIKPTIFFQRQGKYNETIIGSDYIFNISSSTIISQTISAGLYYRVKDAIILMGKYNYRNINIGLSYDINLSALTKASQSYGAVELWILYSFAPLGYKKSRTTIPCPEF